MPETMTNTAISLVYKDISLVVYGEFVTNGRSRDFEVAMICAEGSVEDLTDVFTRRAQEEIVANATDLAFDGDESC